MVLAGEIADIRRIMQVFDNDMVTTHATWGRSSPLSGSGKVNIAADGKVVSTFVLPDSDPCAKQQAKFFLSRIANYKKWFKKLP